MMWRPNSFVRYICIILMLFNCSASAEHANFGATTVNRAISDVPTASLYVINGNQDVEHVPNETKPSLSQHEDTFDSGHNENIDESSQQNAVNLVLLPKLAINNRKNRAENSETQPMVESQRHKRNSEAQDVCDTAECKCKSESKFLTVDCHFQHHYTLDASKFVHPTADSLLITLASGTDFKLDGNVLTENRLNRIKIQGSEMDSGHVEIAKNAFNNNSGPFPDIEIVNVESVIIQSHAFYREFKLNISNCAKVQIRSEAFANTEFHGHFENIPDLQLDERAFSNSSAKVTIQDSGMTQVERLDAILKEIKFSNTRIGTIRSHAFDAYSIDSIIFDKCDIERIESNAFPEKLLCRQLSFTNCNTGTIEPYAISGSGINDFNLHNNSIGMIKGKAIKLTSVTASIQYNNIVSTERFWFRIEEWCTVLVDNNHFGVYQQIGVELTKDPKKCSFDNNYITKTVADSLNFKNPICRIKQVSFDSACSCNSTYFRSLSHNDIGAESFCKIDATLSHCFNASLYNVKSYKDDICDDSAQIDCVRDRINAKANGYFIDLNRFFNRTDKLLYVYVGVAIVLVIVIIMLLILIARRCFRSKKDFDEGPTRDIVLMERLHPTGTLTTQLYASQAFLDADLVIIDQTLREMKKKYPPEIYDQMDNNTRKLIGGNLTETDKVKTIGEIVQSINECENADIDFIAFTDILYTHLDTSGTTQTHQLNGPIYAEPGLVHLDIINSTNGGRNNNNFVGDAEHIYAEPTNLQQPLLRSEYNVPCDNRMSTSHMYTEPITGAIDYVASPQPKNPITKNFDPSHLYALPSKSTTRTNPTAICPTAEPSTSSTFANHHQPKISFLGERFKNSTHSSSQESNNSHSDHSGASGVTLPLDEPIEYADA